MQKKTSGSRDGFMPSFETIKEAGIITLATAFVAAAVFFSVCGSGIWW
ncbi:MAG: hypothetical protein Q4B75_09560 [Eubacteriales bacterium]|nr:hypothetical protein [Eubacteriales bacterium]